MTTSIGVQSLTDIPDFCAHSLTDTLSVGAKLLTDRRKLLLANVLTRSAVGGHRLGLLEPKHPSVTTIPPRKLKTPTAAAPRVAAERGVSLVEMAAIHIMSEPLDLPELRDGLARGTFTAKPTAIHGWPLLLTREQLCDYLQVSWSSLSKSCPVAPLELGVNVVRYSRLQIDEWIAGLPPRDKRDGQQAPVSAEDTHRTLDNLVDPRLAALELARARPVRRK